MAFDEKLAGRIRNRLARRKGLTERRMFGGIGFMLNGNICCGVHGERMIVRLSPDESEAALKKAHVRVFDLTGRAMKGWIFVDPAGVRTDASLGKWVDVAVGFAGKLPPK
ncbi:MAG: TfoX/Sxy family protein [Acidobacteria bacterium]|nr:TfoX/Sxy family protein [Acidobacteriota bacterium]